VSREVGADFDILRALNHGYLPRHYLADDAGAFVRAYVDDYLKEEVMRAGLVAQPPAFSGFRRRRRPRRRTVGELQHHWPATAAVSPVRDKGVLPYLVDTLLGAFLPAYRKRPQRRVVQTPKFYFADRRPW